jgi:hypothetical protein
VEQPGVRGIYREEIMAVVVYQSGQKVEQTGWYEPVGVTQPIVPTATTLAAGVNLKAGMAFPDWKGRAICWRLYAVDVADISQRKAANDEAGV